MLDIRRIREQTDDVKAGLAKLGAADMVDHILEADARARELRHKWEQVQAERNRLSKEVGKTKDAAEREPLIAQVKGLKDELDTLQEGRDAAELEVRELLLQTPNVPDPSVPPGETDADNVIIRQSGEQPEFDFTPLANWDLGPQLGIIDFERGVKVGGTRSYFFVGLGARLQRTLINFMLDVHLNEHGYTEVAPPYMVTEECLIGTGNLPKFRETLFRIEDEDRYLIPTSEVPVTNIHREEILEEADLPKSYVAYSPCFRDEKMSAGRDTRGIKRVFQFDKVEMVKFTTPERGMGDFEHMLSDASKILEKLGLCYRVAQSCTGELSFVSCVKYDLELWAAGCEEWLEVSSISYFSDYQARRANIRYRPSEPKAKPKFCHTMNGSGVALPRLMIAILENGQQADGSVRLPEALGPYWQGDLVIPAVG